MHKKILYTKLNLKNFWKSQFLIPRDKPIKTGDVHFALTTRKIQNRTCHGPQDCYLEPLPIKLIVHGWLESKCTSHYVELMEKYLQKRNCNVIQADWSKLSGLTYVNAIQTSISVGNYIGKFIVRLLDSGLTSHNRIHLIGHSLGAHIAGIAGKETFRLTGKEIGRISGLDPAKQLFEIPSCPDSARLQQTDAELVDITHTDCLLFGFKKPLGTVDFYFNGSRFQPGNRPPNLNVLWNKDDFQEYLFYGHRKSCKYFMDSINNRDIIGWKCKSLENVRRKIYDMTDETIYGENISESAQGIYFVKT